MPPLEPLATLDWADETHTAAFAQALAPQLQARADQALVITLDGPLGAGKTTTVRHLLRALGVTGRIKSPSYALVEPYELAPAWPAWHFDFYRLGDASEWEDAGFRDIFGQAGLKLVEWPDKAGALLPPADLQLRLTMTFDAQATSPVRRGLHVFAHTEAGRHLWAQTAPTLLHTPAHD